MRLAPVVLLAACSPAYRPGSFADGRNDFSGERVTVGCLDVAIARRSDLGDASVLQYQFGNRCSHDTLVDLAHIRVIGRAIDGTEHRLVPHDPRRELRALDLDPRRSGLESIAYRGPTPSPAEQVCVDVASLVHEGPARWVCFARSVDADANEGES